MRLALCLLCGVLFCAVCCPAEEPAMPVAAAVSNPVARAFVERVEAALAAAEGTPGQEAANFLRTPTAWPREQYLLVASPSSTVAQVQGAIAGVSNLLVTIESGPTWPLHPVIRVPYARKPPVIDGRLDDPVWAKAATFSAVCPFGSTNRLDAPRTTWKILWDKRCLYFAFDCEDEDIVAPALKRDDPVFSYDCVEMFILPAFRMGSYWELVIGPTGCIYDGLNSKKFREWGALIRANQNIEGLRVGCQVDGTPNVPGDRDRGYTVEVAVPFDQLPEYSRASPSPGQTLRFMLVRLDKNGDVLRPYAFQPLLNWGHNIWNHETMELVR